MIDPRDTLPAVRQRIARACRACGRDPASVQLLAVSKTRSTRAIRAVWEAGQRCFGENYLQEALDKQPALADLPITWHFIGPLQSNKTRAVAERFAWVHSVDRVKIAERLSRQRPADSPALQVCLQVNIDREPQKAGCLPESVEALADAVARLDRLTLRGLMTLPRADNDPQPAFARLSALFQTLRQSHPQMDTLSMGMSGDLEAAIAEGATLVRVGTALFGPRTANTRETDTA